MVRHMVCGARGHDILVSAHLRWQNRSADSLVISLVPETRLLTLEQLDDVFNQSDTDFGKWAIRKEGRWVADRFLFLLRLRSRPGERPQLYGAFERNSPPGIGRWMERDSSFEMETVRKGQ